MKMGAVDCELNFNENKDGTYTCINFRGGDFLYHPNLAIDVTRWSRFQFTKVDLTKPVEVEKITTVTIKGIKYILKPVYEPSGSGKIDHFDIYTEDDKTTKKGTWNVDADGKNPKKSKDAMHITKK
jgi:hypothetical protein